MTPNPLLTPERLVQFYEGYIIIRNSDGEWMGNYQTSLYDVFSCWNTVNVLVYKPRVEREIEDAYRALGRWLSKVDALTLSKKEQKAKLDAAKLMLRLLRGR